MTEACAHKKVRLKYRAHVEMGQSPPSIEYSSSPDDGLPFLQGTADFGPIHPVPRTYCESPTKVASKGDILFSVRAPVGELNVADQDVGIGRGLCAIRTGTFLNPRFGWWALHEARYRLNFISTGSTYEAVATEDIANMAIETTDIEKQGAIAGYLDRETTRLDALVAAKESVLDLLSEKRKALIVRAVTRGLDPTAPLRDSGIPWLGKIPAHWELKRAKWMFSERDERSSHGEETLLSLRMERGLVPHNEVSEKQTRPEELIGYKRTSPGEIVVNRMRAAIGLIAVAPQVGLVSPDYAVFIPVCGISVTYYYYLFTTELLGAVFRSVSTGMGTGSSGFLRLYSESFLALWLPHPPADEQRAIVDFIIHETAVLNKLHAATERTITLLKEHRAALIAAAVTGQIDVEAAA